MKTIKNYKELQAEQKRLEENLILQKAALKNDFASLKDSLKPMSLLKDMVGLNNTNGDIGPLAGAGINAGIDLVLRNNVLAKAGFVVRTIVPMALKTIVNFFSKRRRKESPLSNEPMSIE
jgi:hypothetical protein